jgi:hypothetical protein
MSMKNEKSVSKKFNEEVFGMTISKDSNSLYNECTSANTKLATEICAK